MTPLGHPSSKQRVQSERLADLLRTMPRRREGRTNDGARMPQVSVAVTAAAPDGTLDSLRVQTAVLLARARRAEDSEGKLRSEMIARQAAHDVELSEHRARLATYEAELARAQADNSLLRKDNQDIALELADAQRELGENELEILELRRRLQLPPRASTIRLN